MKYNQNEKILQISNETLIIGVDVASETHYARAFDYRGIELGKLIRFDNNAVGFATLGLWIRELRLKHHKQHVMVGMEPTGHYWFNLAQFLKDHNLQGVLVNPYHVNRSKELDDNNPTKNDRKDPKTIAMLVKDGRYMTAYVPEGIFSDLRTTMETRWVIVKQLNAIRNRMKRWISIYFPEFNTVFADWEGKAALAALKKFPLPVQVLEKGVDNIVSCWKEEKIKTVGMKRAIKLIEAAKTSVGVRSGVLTAENNLLTLIEDYEMKMLQYERTMVIVDRLVFQIPGASEMLKIKGIGLVGIAGFIAEVGDIRRFEHPKQIQKLAGLNLIENSSGKHKGMTTISKRGRSRLRAILYQSIMPLVSKNPEFIELHGYYTTRAQNPLKKKQSLILLCCKLIRLFYAILVKGIKYDPQKMLSDIRRPLIQKVA